MSAEQNDGLNQSVLMGYFLDSILWIVDQGVLKFTLLWGNFDNEEIRLIHVNIIESDTYNIGQ